MELDIIKNISAIEKLKCNILKSTSDLYTNMTNPYSTIEEKRDNLSDIIISAYLLSERIGLNPTEIDNTIINKLKIQNLNGANISELYKRINQR